MSRLRNRRIVLSAAAGVGQRGVQLATALVTLPLVLHCVGQAGFGVWGAASSLAWAAGLLDLGLGAALVSLVPRALAAGEPAAPLVAASLYGGGAVGCVLLGACGLLAARGAAPVFLVAAVGLAINVPLSMAGNLWFGVQKGQMAGLWELVQTLLTLAFLLAAAAAAKSVVWLVAAVYAGLVLGNLASLAVFLRQHPALRPGRTSGAALAAMLRQSGPLFLLNLVTLPAFVFDNVLALRWLGADASGQMTVALRLCLTASGFLAVASQALWPAFAEAVAVRDHAWVVRTLWRGTGLLAGLALAGSAVLVLAGPVALPLWLGKGVVIPPALLWAMAAWITVLAVPRVAGLLLNAAGVLWPQIFITLAAVLLAFGLKFGLAPHAGVAGILVAAPLAWAAIVCPAYLWLAARQ